MKYIYKICGKISLLFYIFILYQLWHLCQYGGLRRHLPVLITGVAGFLITLILWLVSRKYKREDVSKSRAGRMIFLIEIFIFLIGTLCFGGSIIYSATPYHGALSWKMDEWTRKKEVTLKHNNFFEDGAEGMLADLDDALDLPEELYIVNKYQMTFEEDGRIQTIYTFLYGKDKNGETRSYLVDYDADKNEDMTVWMNGEANGDYSEDMRLAPMLKILQEADCEQQVKEWSQSRKTAEYEILYSGRSSFKTEEGLRYLSGDADGDGVVTGTDSFEQLRMGGEIAGFEVSLHILKSEEVTPVRYIMEPEYISREVLDQERQEQQEEEAKDAEAWTLDKADGTMYFFLDKNRGWRLVVADAAAGSRFYRMEKTENGGSTWESVNEDPFGGSIGVTEGLVFFDETFGFAGLTGASGSASQLYVTRDGGVTFEKLQLPLDTVTELPALGLECGFTVEDYDYIYMPEKEGDVLTVKVVTGAGETEGFLFQSQDNGETWEYTGITSK